MFEFVTQIFIQMYTKEVDILIRIKLLQIR